MDASDARIDNDPTEGLDVDVEGWYVASAEGTPAPYEYEDRPQETIDLFNRIFKRLGTSASVSP